jgi:hypothetical protein
MDNTEDKKPFIEPKAIKAGDLRVLANGHPIEVDYRIISEDNYQLLFHASQQTEALQAEIEQMHKECYGWADIVGNQDKKILEKDARISQLEEALRELLHNSVNDKGFPQIATAIQLRKAQKALSQNNQPEK